MTARRRIAIVGSGISGLTAAWLLHREHDITLLEADTRLGGHTATRDITLDGRDYAIDTGFIVFNERTYPNFIRLLDTLGVTARPTSMSFSLRCETHGLEYCGSNLNGLFAQRRNLVRPVFWRMLRDILRFNREAVRHLGEGVIDDSTTLGDYLRAQGYSMVFAEQYLLPMTAAIWSAGADSVRAMPLRFFVRFFHNHGLLQVCHRPAWFVVEGGSRRYIDPLVAGFRERVETGVRIDTVRREADRVRLRIAGEWRNFDAVVLACHSDQALALLEQPTAEERAVLGAIPYRENRVVLHTDTRMLPRSRRAWASWNYHRDSVEQDTATVTYNMNMLQGVVAPHTFCVTLNDTGRIDPACVLEEYRYSHPVFTLDGLAAQRRRAEINGRRRTWFCGAYWRNGFHEDGVWSALNVAEGLGGEWPA